MPSVCVDANVIVKLAVKEEVSDLAEAKWEQWERQQTNVVAPPFLWYEVASVLRNKVYRRLLHLEEAGEALIELLALPVSIISPPGLHESAWVLATRFNRPNAYDANYLAVAEYLGCPFWTADGHLYNSVKSAFPEIYLIS